MSSYLNEVSNFLSKLLRLPFLLDEGHPGINAPLVGLCYRYGNQRLSNKILGSHHEFFPK